ncbi:hypothetical protein [Leptospira sp. GIMC2001]|uniref:hypothetical protein n=1 Tax=Leptospira sp. GIMC2001 TaxID=1513297 RepID=UPI00234BABF2|nr:hypothetical protein [Leptospira sp. GIMC2001]WCL51507.1 hypothetical protein O4O04_20030 [Leptospira sp. GIMC2001]
MTRTFKGFTYNNPDTIAHRDLLQIVYSGKELHTLETMPESIGWGSLVTSDEIRYSLMSGNGRLTTVDGSQITNENLDGFVDQTVRALSEELEHDIYPTLYRHRPTGNGHRMIEPHAKWYDAHDYQQRDPEKNFYINLRHRPIIKILKWDFVNPINRDQNSSSERDPIIDLMPRLRVTYDTGIVQSVGIIGGGAQFNRNAAMRSHRILSYGPTKMPNCYYLDFISGYDQASRVPAELRELVGLIVAIKVMSIYGDGRAAGVASFSISAGVLHESVSTTQSATSAMYGARILELKVQVKEWYERHFNRYKPIRMAIL